MPSSCLLCFNSTPNSHDGSFDRVLLMCRLFERGMSALPAEAHTGSSHAVFVLIPRRRDECIRLGPLPAGWGGGGGARYAKPTALEQAAPVSSPVECSAALWLILITGSTRSARLFLSPPLTLPITEFLHPPWHNSSGILSLSLSSESVFPKTLPLIYHWPVC